MHGTEVLEQGRRAFHRREWAAAHQDLAAAAQAGPLEPDDLERLATAAHLTGRDDPSADGWRQAYAARLARSEHERAARCAFWLGFGLMMRGEPVQGGAWLTRAQQLLEQHDLDCVERGYLLLPGALGALEHGDGSAALAVFEQMSALAARFGDADLAAFGSLGRGEALLRLGEGADAMRQLDEAMVSVTAGETSPVVSGIVYCAVIDACHRAFDLQRAREWTAALDRWCAGQPDLVPYRGQCLVHRAQVLQVAGAWQQAVVEAERARQRLTDPPHPAVALAHYLLGELHRLRGEVAAAEEDYRQAHAGGREPQPGLSLLRLDEGRVDAAVTAISRALDDAGSPVARAQLLPTYVEVMLAARGVPAAAAAADELEALAERIDTTLLRAVAAHCRGAVLLAQDEPKAALHALRSAVLLWQGLEAPYEGAQSRVLASAACRALRDDDQAELEGNAARAVFEQLGAAPALARLSAVSAAGLVGPPVTARELQVLRLLAAGRTNHEIAEELVISEKTVERHVGNIFTKLDVPNRSSATAYAYAHRLVQP